MNMLDFCKISYSDQMSRNGNEPDWKVPWPKRLRSNRQDRKSRLLQFSSM